ncbi:MAG TPA: biopolymer transporter Tol [Candidatus Didemnitutus sp.]|nr:biopolymer transporter Tol [Candidatus Didemnitutus sp.]
MQNLIRLLLGLMLVVPVFADRNIGDITVSGDTHTIPITVTSSSPELQNLARVAFESHGKFKVVGSGAAFNFVFTPAGGSQVQVSITKGSAGTPVQSEVVAGTSLRNALLKAADAAVKITTGTRGFFAGRLAFVADRGGVQTIMVGDLFLGDLQSYPVNGKQIVGPRWAPDGNRIVFTSYRTGFPDIYVLDLASRQMNVFASFKGTNSGAHFSPDGSRVAMVLSGEGNPEIYVSNAQGRQIRRVTNTPSVEASPCWSPDGSRLVFTSDAYGGPQLFVMSAAGGSMSRLGTNISKYCAEPDWSTADPNKIVFTAGMGGSYQSAVYEFNGGAARIVTHAPVDAIEPVWLGDGRHILCTFRTATSRALYIVDTDPETRHEPTRLTPSSVGNAWAASYLAR